MEALLHINPSIFFRGKALREYLPSGFTRNVIKSVPIYDDKLNHFKANGINILCITRQGHLIQFDEDKHIIRTCNLELESPPKKGDIIDMRHFLSSNGKWLVAIHFDKTCYIYVQEKLSFERIEKKCDVKAIFVDDFWSIGSQQLHIVFSNNQPNITTDFNPVAPAASKKGIVDKGPNETVSKSLMFQLRRSKISLHKALSETKENEDTILSVCNWLSRSIVGTNLLPESQLISDIFGCKNIKNVVKFTPQSTDNDFKNLKTNSMMFQYCGYHVLVYSLDLGSNNNWRVTGLSTEFCDSKPKTLCNRFQINNELKHFSESDSIAELAKKLFKPGKNISMIDKLSRNVYITQQFESSLLHDYVNKLNPVIEISNSTTTRCIYMPSIDLQNITNSNLCNLDDCTTENFIRKFCAILSVMKRRAVVISSIATDLPDAFSECLQTLEFKRLDHFPNIYLNLNAGSNLKGIIVLVRSEKSQRVKVDLYAENENLLKMLVKCCYTKMPQDIEISLPKKNVQMKNKLLQKKNCLLNEVSHFCKLFQNATTANPELSSLSPNGSPSAAIHEFGARKRRFDGRKNHVEVPLETFFAFQDELKRMEKQTDILFT